MLMAGSSNRIWAGGSPSWQGVSRKAGVVASRCALRVVQDLALPLRPIRAPCLLDSMNRTRFASPVAGNSFHLLCGLGTRTQVDAVTPDIDDGNLLDIFVAQDEQTCAKVRLVPGERRIDR